MDMRLRTGKLFFFFFCLFYSDSIDKSWSVTRVNDLKHLNQKNNLRNSISANHITFSRDLAVLASVNIASRLHFVYRQHVEKHMNMYQSKILKIIEF